ncbi:hypothetical protein HS053_18840 [Tabrizicola sp. SY72]|nr:hypothetical protein [Tabrizicola sp. SY72]
MANDGTGAPTLSDMGTGFAIATGGVLTLFIAAPPNGSVSVSWAAPSQFLPDLRLRA